MFSVALAASVSVALRERGAAVTMQVEMAASTDNTIEERMLGGIYRSVEFGVRESRVVGGGKSQERRTSTLYRSLDRPPRFNSIAIDLI